MSDSDATGHATRDGDAGAIYGTLADWWPLFSSPAHYLEEAHAYRTLLLEAGDPPPRTVLELGSGGGGNASHLKLDFALTLVDRAPGMLAVSRALNPECEHLLGDMRDVRLGRTFDAVFVHDAIAYILTGEDLAAVFATAFEHTKPGGVALFVPDYVMETFVQAADHGGHDGPDRALGVGGRGQRQRGAHRLAHEHLARRDGTQPVRPLHGHQVLRRGAVAGEGDGVYLVAERSERGGQWVHRRGGAADAVDEPDDGHVQSVVSAACRSASRSLPCTARVSFTGT